MTAAPKSNFGETRLTTSHLIRFELLDDLLPRVLFTRVTAMLGEVFASEHSARMTAMQLATDNATELIEELTLVRNRMRQAAITKELADIVGAAEAIA